MIILPIIHDTLQRTVLVQSRHLPLKSLSVVVPYVWRNILPCGTLFSCHDSCHVQSSRNQKRGLSTTLLSTTRVTSHAKIKSLTLCAKNQQQQQQQAYHHSPILMMAGHNKWSKIRHKKGAKDVKRATILGKASRSVTAASKECNGDLTNLRLQSAIQYAKSVQLPKDKLEEAIEKGTIAYQSKSGEGDLLSLRYDAMIKLMVQDPANNDSKSIETAQVACIITALSDNRNRTSQNVRHLVTKAGGDLLPTDNLNYLFQHVGIIFAEEDQQQEYNSIHDFEERLMECALDAGAINIEEIQEDDNDGDDSNVDKPLNSKKTFVVTTEDRDLWHVVQDLQEHGINVSQFEHRYIVQDDDNEIRLSRQAWEQFEDILQKMDDDMDVNHVYHNAT